MVASSPPKLFVHRCSFPSQPSYPFPAKTIWLSFPSRSTRQVRRFIALASPLWLNEHWRDHGLNDGSKERLEKRFHESMGDKGTLYESLSLQSCPAKRVLRALSLRLHSKGFPPKAVPNCYCVLLVEPPARTYYTGLRTHQKIKVMSHTTFHQDQSGQASDPG